MGGCHKTTIDVNRSITEIFSPFTIRTNFNPIPERISHHTQCNMGTTRKESEDMAWHPVFIITHKIPADVL